MDSEWTFEVERSFSILYVDFYIEALRAEWFQLVYDIQYSCQNYKILRGREYWKKKDLLQLDRMYRDAYREEPSFLPEHARRTYAACEQLTQRARQLLRIDWGAVSINGLANEWTAFCSDVFPVAAATNMRPVGFIEDQLSPLIDSITSRRCWKEPKAELVAAINSVDRSLAYKDEPMDLLKIGVMIQQNSNWMTLFDSSILPETIEASLPNGLRQMLEAHREEYCWMNHPYAAYRKSFTVQDYIQRLQHLVARSSCLQEVMRIEHLRATDQERFRAIVEATESELEAILIRAARDYAFLRTYMVEVMDRSFFVLRETLLRELGRRLELPDSLIVCMTIQEIFDAIVGLRPVVSFGELVRRASEYAFVLDEGCKDLVCDKTEIDYYEESTEALEKGVKPPSSLTGIVASRGTAVGSVKILRSPRDIEKVHSGDVIIAAMTTPEYIAAMEKAAAFVTDEGGITCHAAITSRELGIPCIVGTQTASLVFKDNEIVQVDAFNGIIRRL